MRSRNIRHKKDMARILEALISDRSLMSNKNSFSFENIASEKCDNNDDH